MVVRACIQQHESMAVTKDSLGQLSDCIRRTQAKKCTCFEFAFEELVSICDSNGSSEEVLNIPAKFLSSKRAQRIIGNY